MKPGCTKPILTSITSLALFHAPAVHADVLVGWDEWFGGSEAPTVTGLGATGSSSETGDWREGTEAASNDGTFGTATGASTDTGAAKSGTLIGVTTGSGSYDFTITAGSEALALETFHFDADGPGGSLTLTLSGQAPRFVRLQVTPE